MKIAAIIVTYNRKEMLLENLKQILNQIFMVDKIIIIDNNGTDNTYEYIKKSNEINMNLIDYVYLDTNIGGAGGFYTGVKKAYEEAYDWMILMDDDGRPYNKYTFKKVFEYIENKNINAKEKVMLNSLVIENEEKLSFGLLNNDSIKVIKDLAEDGIIIGEVNNFNGTIISNGLVQNIGYPDKDFFIKGDEVDYMNRAKKSGAFVATLIDSLYYHPAVKTTNSIKIFNKTINMLIESPWKEYYSIRNYTYMYFQDKKYNRIIKLFILKILSILFCKNKKIQTLKMICKGGSDGIRRRMGKRVNPF